PRCGSNFECKANRVERCGCLSVALTAETLEYLGDRYRDCLCVACLEQVNQMCSKEDTPDTDPRAADRNLERHGHR
ncbi:cysteine-rich CWC family protein, partial [Thiocapsa sp.]|uniref:cysteine-rich CWC family protein n=1 Tax=Thiocapsa sp. TaxID=2024551 RepID=UPI00341DEEC2